MAEFHGIFPLFSIIKSYLQRGGWDGGRVGSGKTPHLWSTHNGLCHINRPQRRAVSRKSNFRSSLPNYAIVLVMTLEGWQNPLRKAYHLTFNTGYTGDG